MKSLVVQGQTLPMPLVRGFLMREGVVESLVSTVFHLPGPPLGRDMVQIFSTPELEIRRTILEDCVLIEWEKFGHTEDFLKGFRSDEELLSADAVEFAFGKCIVNTRQATGSHEDRDIERGKTYYYTFFIPADVPRFLLLKIFVKDRHRSGFTTFSGYLSDYTDVSTKLSELVRRANLEQQLVNFAKAMKPDDEKRLEKFQSALMRHDTYTKAREKAGAELRAKKKQIKADTSLSDSEKSVHIQEAESTHLYLLEMLHKALID